MTTSTSASLTRLSSSERDQLRNAIERLAVRRRALAPEVPHFDDWRSMQMIAGYEPDPSWRLFDFLIGWAGEYADEADRTGDSGEAWAHWHAARDTLETLTGASYEPKDGA